MSVIDDIPPCHVVSSNLADLPINSHPSYTEYGMNGICTAGSALFNVHSYKCRVTAGCMVLILPYQLASVCEISDDFSMKFFTVSGTCYLEIMSSLRKLTPDFFFWMRHHYIYKASE